MFIFMTNETFFLFQIEYVNKVEEIFIVYFEIVVLRGASLSC